MALLEIFLIASPGLEQALGNEARAAGFQVSKIETGGVTLAGGWPDIWRANLMLRGASSVLVRLGSFPASHLSELDKRARKFPWAQYLPKGCAVNVTVTCKASRIYHSGAVKQRVAAAIQDALGVPTQIAAPVSILVRIERNHCTVSLDTSGESLHRRGHKQAVGKAPIRETMAALLLRECGYVGNEPVLDPMCGSGTFVIEAAEIALGLAPGRARNFAFENLPGFDAAAFAAIKAKSKPLPSSLHFFGFDRDAGAIAGATSNAGRAGVGDIATFRHQSLSALERPEGPPGLVICNPPYGGRIGDSAQLKDLYAAFGHVMVERFAGWRIGLITNTATLAGATGLVFAPTGAPLLHGGLRVRLYQSTISG